jgi:hypothetical protein
MRKSSTCVALSAILALSGCAVAPLTQEELNFGVSEEYLTQQCIRKGWTYDPANFAAYLTQLENRMAMASTPEQVKATRNALSAQGQLGVASPEVCREVEARAIQRMQRVQAQAASDAAAAASAQQFSDSAAAFSDQSARQLDAARNRQRNVTCLSNPGGRSGSCYSY